MKESNATVNVSNLFAPVENLSVVRRFCIYEGSQTNATSKKGTTYSTFNCQQILERADGTQYNKPFGGWIPAPVEGAEQCKYGDVIEVEFMEQNDLARPYVPVRVVRIVVESPYIDRSRFEQNNENAKLSDAENLF